MQKDHRSSSSPASQGGRGSPAHRGRGGRGRGGSDRKGTDRRPRSGYTNTPAATTTGDTNQYGRGRGGYTHPSARSGHTNTSNTPSQQRAGNFFQPRPQAAPGQVSEVNKSMWATQEKKLHAINACPSCFTIGCRTPCPNKMIHIWDCPNSILHKADIKLSHHQLNKMFPNPQSL